MHLSLGDCNVDVPANVVNSTVVFNRITKVTIVLFIHRVVLITKLLYSKIATLPPPLQV